MTWAGARRDIALFGGGWWTIIGKSDHSVDPNRRRRSPLLYPIARYSRSLVAVRIRPTKVSSKSGLGRAWRPSPERRRAHSADQQADGGDGKASHPMAMMKVAENRHGDEEFGGVDGGRSSYAGVSWTSRLDVTIATQPPPPAASRNPPARPRCDRPWAVFRCVWVIPRAADRHQAPSDRRAPALATSALIGSANRRRSTPPITPGNDDPPKQPPVDVCGARVADARKAVVKVSAVWNPADCGRCGTPRITSMVLEICPNAMPSAVDICAAKPIRTTAGGQTGSTNSSAKMLPHPNWSILRDGVGRSGQDDYGPRRRSTGIATTCLN